MNQNQDRDSGFGCWVSWINDFLLVLAHTGKWVGGWGGGHWRGGRWLTAACKALWGQSKNLKLLEWVRRCTALSRLYAPLSKFWDSCACSETERLHFDSTGTRFYFHQCSMFPLRWMPDFFFLSGPCQIPACAQFRPETTQMRLVKVQFLRWSEKKSNSFFSEPVFKHLATKMVRFITNNHKAVTAAFYVCVCVCFLKPGGNNNYFQPWGHMFTLQL